MQQEIKFHLLDAPHPFVRLEKWYVDELVIIIDVIYQNPELLKQ